MRQKRRRAIIIACSTEAKSLVVVNVKMFPRWKQLQHDCWQHSTRTC